MKTRRPTIDQDYLSFHAGSYNSCYPGWAIAQTPPPPITPKPVTGQVSTIAQLHALAYSHGGPMVSTRRPGRSGLR